jgi:hypothetical protein
LPIWRRASSIQSAIMLAPVQAHAQLASAYPVTPDVSVSFQRASSACARSCGRRSGGEGVRRTYARHRPALSSAIFELGYFFSNALHNRPPTSATIRTRN